MKKGLVIALAALFLLGCGQTGDSDGAKETSENSKVESQEAQEDLGYEQVSMEEAIKRMEEEKGYVLLDVRSQVEYDRGHIPTSICIPVEEIDGERLVLLPNKDQTIYVYCRSGNRSKTAAKALADMGYTHIVEFGGIIDWPGDRTEALTLTSAEDPEEEGTTIYTISDGIVDTIITYKAPTHGVYLDTGNPILVGYFYDFFKQELGNGLNTVFVGFNSVAGKEELLLSKDMGLLEFGPESYDVIETEPQWLVDCMAVKDTMAGDLKTLVDQIAKEIVSE